MYQTTSWTQNSLEEEMEDSDSAMCCGQGRRTKASPARSMFHLTHTDRGLLKCIPRRTLEDQTD